MMCKPHNECSRPSRFKVTFDEVVPGDWKFSLSTEQLFPYILNARLKQRVRTGQQETGETLAYSLK